MASVNKVIILGNAGKDAEIRYSPSGMAIANVSVATSSRRKDKQSGEQIEETQWHRITFYDRLAEIAGEYITKGKSVYIEGKLKYGKYTDKDGVERYTTDIVADQLQLLGGRENDGGGDDYRAPQSRGQQRAQAPQGRQSAPQQGRPQQQRGGGATVQGRPPFDDIDSDIPFIFADSSAEVAGRNVARSRRAR